MRNSLERYRQLCAKGLTVPQIAARLGVNRNTVYQTCKRHGISVAAAPLGKTGISSASGASLHIENATTDQSDENVSCET